MQEPKNQIWKNWKLNYLNIIFLCPTIPLKIKQWHTQWVSVLGYNSWTNAKSFSFFFNLLEGYMYVFVKIVVKSKLACR